MQCLPLYSILMALFIWLLRLEKCWSQNCLPIHFELVWEMCYFIPFSESDNEISRYQRLHANIEGHIDSSNGSVTDFFHKLELRLLHWRYGSGRVWKERNEIALNSERLPFSPTLGAKHVWRWLKTFDFKSNCYSRHECLWERTGAKPAKRVD